MVLGRSTGSSTITAVQLPRYVRQLAVINPVIVEKLVASLKLTILYLNTSGKLLKLCLAGSSVTTEFATQAERLRIDPTEAALSYKYRKSPHRHCAKI